MQTSLEEIANKARSQKRYRFRNLFRELNEGLLQNSWMKLNKKAAVGVDRISYREYGENLTGNIRDLVGRLKKKRYHAKLVKRHYIPKGNGKKRPLGIPATEDKLLQHAVAQILQAIYEQDFLVSSYGYRPSRGTRKATHELRENLFRGRYNYVVEADIEGFFETLDHEWLVKMLEQRINDKALIWLIRKWLKAGVLDTDGKVKHPVTGTPQGGIISPILANIYMHYVLNLWFEKVVKKHCRGRGYLCVYADDFVTAFQYEKDAQRFYKVLGKRLAKFGLKLSEEKTKLIRFGRSEKERNKTFDFLGFEYQWTKNRQGKRYIKLTTSRKKLKSSLQNMRKWCKENRHQPLKKFFEKLKTKLQGYYNYYGIAGNWRAIGAFHYWVEKTLVKWLNRRSQRKSYNKQGFTQLFRHYGICRPKLGGRTLTLLVTGQS